METLYKPSQNRKQCNSYLIKVFTVMFVIVFLIIIGCQQDDKPTVINATQFNLVDSTGKVVAQLKVDKDGPGLFILDEEGRQRAVVIHQKDLTGFFALDTNGDPRVGAVHYPHGGSGFALHGEHVKGAAVLYLDPKNQGSVTFYDTSGNMLNRFSSTK